MRHGKKVNHLGRKSAHRHALLSNMASSLILNKRITTTVAKAKALRKYVEPLLTKSKDNTTHSRRTVFAYLQNKESIKALFGEVAGRIANRPGGYTRIIKLGEVRLGDAADMCMMELVDFNDIYKKDGVEKKTKTRRSRAKKSEGVVEDAKVEGEVNETEEKPKKATKKSKKDE
jgi:large subunit ribosomal protein L17